MLLKTPEKDDEMVDANPIEINEGNPILFSFSFSKSFDSDNSTFPFQMSYLKRQIG